MAVEQVVSPAAVLETVVGAVRAHPGLRNKAPIGLVAEVFGAGDWLAGPGDDGAVVVDDGATMVVGGESIWPPFLEADPFGAGVAAVLANVNDLAAMGARPLAIVDTVTGPEPVARRALEGMRHASALYQVPVVGGHLTIRDGPPALSAFGLGRADGPVLSARHAAAGQGLLVACCVEGTMRADFPFFASFDARGTRLGGDVRTLAAVAGSGAAVAAKDVSMAGLLGSLAMLLECHQLGVTVDLEALPRPAGVSLPAWVVAFPCFAFLLCAPAGREEDCARPFRERGLQAAVVGVLDDTGTLRVRLGAETATVMDLTTESVTGLPPAVGS
ncbi:MAG: AIR synthase related protein [Acidimicrobiia bacterium]